MEELSMQQIIRGSYSGQLDNSMTYIHLLIQAGAVLIAGIVLWRASVIFHNRKKAQRNTGGRFETRYSKQWRR
jgi:hypothetical protein